MTAITKTMHAITSARNNKPFTNRQIDTATQMLNDALNGKNRTIRHAAEAKINAKYKKQISALINSFKKDFTVINNAVKKDSNNCIDLHVSTNYSTNRISVSTNSSYQQEQRFASTIPVFKKLQSKVENMILRMKLGENLMDEVIALVNEINNIK